MNEEISTAAEARCLEEMTPRQIVAELDKFIVGQERAKRALAVALRDRLRRQKLPEELAGEIRPRNVILIGPTGVGKTELARRLARISRSPFIKVEASKFTEVGYVGRDVDSIIRDLVEVAVDMVREEKAREVLKQAEELAHERLLEILAQPPSPPRGKGRSGKKGKKGKPKPAREKVEALRRELQEGKLNHRMVELEVPERLYAGADYWGLDVDDDVDFPGPDGVSGVPSPRTIKKRMRVDEALQYLTQEEENKLIDMDQVTREALDRVEQSGIVFIDEMDKIAGREAGFGPEVSREGVQRDILPIVEGTTVGTRFGTVHTDGILFIAAGAFHVAKPSDLIPELQGRFPIRVEMEPLSEKDFRAILTQPQNALTRQYQALLATEGVELEFTEDAVAEIAHMAWLVNETTENIGARRLYTIMELLLEELSFEAPDLPTRRVVIDAGYVRERLAGKVKDVDLSRYIL
ncbi:MAG: ATP-dependent protease ATPase subunit HslU [Acidobacteriota bacterium]